MNPRKGMSRSMGSVESVPKTERVLRRVRRSLTERQVKLNWEAQVVSVRVQHGIRLINC